jgi:hypothetical protein
MLAGIKLLIQLTQEVTPSQILDLMRILKTLFLTLISNKEFTEDGLLKASQSQKLRKLTQNQRHLSHHSMLSQKIIRNKKLQLQKLKKKLN